MHGGADLPNKPYAVASGANALLKKRRSEPEATSLSVTHDALIELNESDSILITPRHATASLPPVFAVRLPAASPRTPAHLLRYTACISVLRPPCAQCMASSTAASASNSRSAAAPRSKLAAYATSTKRHRKALRRLQLTGRK